MKTLLFKDKQGVFISDLHKEGFNKEVVFKELLKTEKLTNGLDGYDLEELIDDKVCNILYSIDENKNICGHVVYETKKKYVQINHITARLENYEETIFDLINSIRSRKAFKQRKWIRIWVLQDFDHIKLCRILIKYGFVSFYDKNNIDMTRFAFKENFKS